MSDFMNTLVKLGATISKVLEGPVLPAVVDIGKDFLNLINESAKVVDTTDLSTLEKMRDDLEPKVMAHADKTENELRG